MAKLYLTLLFALALALALALHATARNIPTDHQVTNPSTDALAPVQENVVTTATTPGASATVGDQKNFIGYGGGIGGWGGIGYVGVLPILGGNGGIGKVGGIGVGGGVGGVGGIVP